MKNPLVLLAALALTVASCTDDSTLNLTESDTAIESAEPILAAKPDCDTEEHPSCKDDGGGGGGDFVPASFPATLDGGGANGMVDAGGQTMKQGNSSKVIGGFNPEYDVALDFDETVAAGVEACVVDHRGGFTPAEQGALLGQLTSASLDRYTIVNIARAGLNGADGGHKIELHWGGGLALTLTQSPDVSKVVPGDGDSGTYRFTGGTLEIRDHTMKRPRFHALDCPNDDAVDVSFDFSGL